MRIAGSFVRDKIETIDPDLVKWETFGAQPSGMWKCFTVPGYILGTWLSGVIFFVGAFIVGINPFGRLNVLAVMFCAFLLLYTFILIPRYLGSKENPINKLMSKLRLPERAQPTIQLQLRNPP